MHGSRVVEWIRTTPRPVNFKFIISQSKMIENRPTLPPQELSFGNPPLHRQNILDLHMKALQWATSYDFDMVTHYVNLHLRVMNLSHKN